MIEISNYGLAEKETGKQVPRNRSTTKAASALPVNNEVAGEQRKSHPRCREQRSRVSVFYDMTLCIIFFGHRIKKIILS